MGKSVMCCKFQIISARGGVGLATNVACEQAPKWGTERRQKSTSEMGLRSPIFLFALYPNREPVHRLLRTLPSTK